MLNSLSSQNHPGSPKFDIDKKQLSSMINKSDAVIIPDVDIKLYPSKVWNPDARLQISTTQWLKKYGLKANNLNSSTLFPKLGFARLEGFNKVLKKPIHSKYGENLFPQHFREDGLTFNVVAKKDRLQQAQQELENAMELYQQRLEWLSSESRRLFGVVEEHNVTFIIDIKVKTKREFDQFICAVERLINEQIRYIIKFNMIRVQDSRYQLSNDLVPVSKNSLSAAVDWLWRIDRTSPTSPSNLVESLIRAAHVKENEAIYLITEGSSSDGSREVLREKVKQLKVPLNIVAYNSKNTEFLNYLQCLVTMTGGRFHTYSFNMGIDAYEGSPIDQENPKASILQKRKVYGGSVGGIGTRNDCVAVFSEMEEARILISQIKSLIHQIPEKQLYDDHYHCKHPLRVWNYAYSKKGMESCCGLKEPHECRYCLEEKDIDKKLEHGKKEEYMSSEEWLSHYGLAPRKLDFYDVLSGVCFRHCDGVVDVLEPPPEDKIDMMEQQDATVHQKLINAKYCDKFAHVRWKDGSLVHVQMSTDVHRLYSERMKICLAAITRRIEWLRQGSRELFGTIMEDQVYILIDTSASMEPHINFIRDKLYILIQEQLRHKSKLNFVAFNSKAIPWRDRLVDVTESNLKSAWHWIEGLNCQGSTNTLAALQFAIKDRGCQGIYLLTDGRPDQPTKTVLAQIRLHYRLPIHTISFNCADLEANTFLCELARETGGRFHYFNEISGGADCTNENGLEAWESEDIRLLKAEYRVGFDSLEKVTKLRDECHKLAWKHEIENKKEHKNSRKTMIPGCIENLNRPQKSPTRFNFENKEPRKYKKGKYSLKRGKVEEIDPNTFLEALTALNDNEQEWILEETQEILDRQTERYKKLMLDEFKEVAATEEEGQIKERPKCKDLTLKQWLHIYGLVPQHMTILDALAPTVIKVKPKYIPIIDRHVVSKVFDEILPISHIVTEGSPRRGYKPVVRLVNPLAVDLKGYQEKLQALIKKYRQKLRQLIKKNISEETLQEFDEMLEQNPLGNDDVKRWIMKTFEDAKWPVCEDELEMFLNEIYIAHKYFIQAGDLLRTSRAQVGAYKDGNFIPEVEFDNDRDLPLVNNDPFSSVLLAAMKGATVLAPGPDDGYYYEAQIINWPNCQNVDVQFNMFAGITTVPVSDCVILPEKSVQITAGMNALVKVYNIDNDRTFYLPGIIISSKIIYPQSKIERFLVTLYNGIESNVRSDEIVVISKDSYDRIVKNIEEKMDNDYHSTNATSMSTSIISFSDSRNKNLSTTAEIANMKSMSKFSIPRKQHRQTAKSSRNHSSGGKKFPSLPSHSPKTKGKSAIMLKSSVKSKSPTKSTKISEDSPITKVAKYNNLLSYEVNFKEQSAIENMAEKRAVFQQQPQIIPYPKDGGLSVNQPRIQDPLKMTQDPYNSMESLNTNRGRKSKPNKSVNQSHPKSRVATPKVTEDPMLHDNKVNHSDFGRVAYLNEKMINDIEGEIQQIKENKVERTLINIDPISKNTIHEEIEPSTFSTNSFSVPTSHYRSRESIEAESKRLANMNVSQPRIEPSISTNPLSSGVKVTPVLTAEHFPMPYSNFKNESLTINPDINLTKNVQNTEKIGPRTTEKVSNIKHSSLLFDSKTVNQEKPSTSRQLDKKRSRSIESESIKNKPRHHFPESQSPGEKKEVTYDQKNSPAKSKSDEFMQSKSKDTAFMLNQTSVDSNKMSSVKSKDKDSKELWGIESKKVSTESLKRIKKIPTETVSKNPEINFDRKFKDNDLNSGYNDNLKEQFLGKPKHLRSNSRSSVNSQKSFEIDSKSREESVTTLMSKESGTKLLPKRELNDPMQKDQSRMRRTGESDEFNKTKFVSVSKSSIEKTPTPEDYHLEVIESYRSDGKIKDKELNYQLKKDIDGKSKQTSLTGTGGKIQNNQPNAEPKSLFKKNSYEKSKTSDIPIKEHVLMKKIDDTIPPTQMIFTSESQEVIIDSSHHSTEKGKVLKSSHGKKSDPSKRSTKRPLNYSEIEKNVKTSQNKIKTIQNTEMKNLLTPSNEKSNQTITAKQQETRISSTSYDRKSSHESKSGIKEKKSSSPRLLSPQSYTANMTLSEDGELGVYNILITPNEALVFPQDQPECKSLYLADLSFTMREVPGPVSSSSFNQTKNSLITNQIDKTHSVSSDELCHKCNLPKVPFGPGQNFKPRNTKSS